MRLRRVDFPTPLSPTIPIRSLACTKRLKCFRIVGDNGVGKSTLLNLIAGRLEATEALATYERAKREDGITVGSDATSPATLANNLKAIELVRAINAYRRQAGLKEL